MFHQGKSGVVGFVDRLGDGRFVKQPTGTFMCFGYTRDRDRMGPKVGWRPFTIGAGFVGQAFEEISSSNRGETGAIQDADTDSIRFVFIVAREVDLLLLLLTMPSLSYDIIISLSAIIG